MSRRRSPLRRLIALFHLEQGATSNAASLILVWEIIQLVSVQFGDVAADGGQVVYARGLQMIGVILLLQRVIHEMLLIRGLTELPAGDLTYAGVSDIVGLLLGAWTIVEAVGVLV